MPILKYFFIPLLICVFTAQAFEVVLPGISFHIWVAVVALSTMAVNGLGIKLADRQPHQHGGPTRRVHFTRLQTM